MNLNKFTNFIVLTGVSTLEGQELFIKISKFEIDCDMYLDVQAIWKNITTRETSDANRIFHKLLKDVTKEEVQQVSAHVAAIMTDGDTPDRDVLALKRAIAQLLTDMGDY